MRKGFGIFITIIILTLALIFFTKQWNIGLIIIALLSIFYFINLEIKQAKTCIIIDTLNLQKLFFEEQQLLALKANHHLTKFYKKWLINYAIEQNLETKYNYFFYTSVSFLCFYCFFNLIPVIVILGITMLSLSYFQAWTITLSFVIISVTFFILNEKKVAKEKYKLLDSEIKRIIFEEETGYSPLTKKNFTFKYKVWLINNDRKNTKSIFVNNI